MTASIPITPRGVRQRHIHRLRTTVWRATWPPALLLIAFGAWNAAWPWIVVQVGSQSIGTMERNLLVGAALKVRNPVFKQQRLYAFWSVERFESGGGWTTVVAVPEYAKSLYGWDHLCVAFDARMRIQASFAANPTHTHVEFLEVRPGGGTCLIMDLSGGVSFGVPVAIVRFRGGRGELIGWARAIMPPGQWVVWRWDRESHPAVPVALLVTFPAGAPPVATVSRQALLQWDESGTVLVPSGSGEIGAKVLTFPDAEPIPLPGNWLWGEIEQVIQRATDAGRMTFVEPTTAPAAGSPGG